MIFPHISRFFLAITLATTFCSSSLSAMRIQEIDAQPQDEDNGKNVTAKIYDFFAKDDAYLESVVKQNPNTTETQHLEDLAHIIKSSGKRLMSDWEERFSRFERTVAKLKRTKDECAPHSPIAQFFAACENRNPVTQMTFLLVLVGLKPLFVLDEGEWPYSNFESETTMSNTDKINSTHNILSNLVNTLSTNPDSFSLIKRHITEEKLGSRTVCLAWSLNPIFPFRFITESYEQFFKSGTPTESIAGTQRSQLKVDIKPALKDVLYTFDDAKTMEERRKSDLVAKRTIADWEKNLFKNIDIDFTACALGFQLGGYTYKVHTYRSYTEPDRAKRLTQIATQFKKIEFDDYIAYSKNFRLLLRPPSVTYCGIASTYDLLYSLLIEYLICKLETTKSYIDYIQEKVDSRCDSYIEDFNNLLGPTDNNSGSMKKN